MKQVQERHRGLVTVLSFALLPLSGFATDVYLPSLPSMSAYFHVSSGTIQSTLLVFLASAGLSQPFVGSLLDNFGRYRISIAAMLLFSFASFAIALTHSIYVLFAMRIIHGIATAIIVVGKRAYFLDTFEGDKLKHYTSLFTIVWAVAPIVAPFIGGYLQDAFGWQASFYFLGIFVLVLMILELIYGGESLKTFQRRNITGIIKVYGSMLGTADYTIGLLILGFSYGMLMVCGLTSPFIIEHVYHYSPVVTGYSALLTGVSMMTGGIISKFLISKPLDKKISVMLLIQFCIAVVMIAVSALIISNLYSLLLFTVLLNISAGFIFNNIYSYALGRFSGNGGMVSGLTGGGFYVITSLFSYGIVSVLTTKNQTFLGVAYLSLSVINVMAFILFQRARNGFSKEGHFSGVFAKPANSLTEAKKPRD